MNRRGFLKGAAGLLSLPIVGKMASSVKSPMVREGIANVANVAQDVPIYFWKLVDKIKNLGKDVTETAGTADRQTVKQYKDFELTEDVATGEIQIFKTSQSDEAIDRFGGENATEEVFMRYKPSEKILLDEANPAGGVRKTIPEYEENTSYISNNRENTGGILDEVDGVPDDIKLDAEMEMELFRKGKADGGIIDLAGGGRVELAKGGIPRALQAALKALKSKYGDDVIKSGDEIESRSELFDDFQTRNPDPNRQMTVEELEDFQLELGDNLEAYSFDGTVGDAKRILDEQENYMAYMYDQYKTGKLDPVAGDKSQARKRLLQKRFEDMEASGDSRLMTRDEIEELSTFDLGVEMQTLRDGKTKSIIPKDEYAEYSKDFNKEILGEDIDISQGMIDLDEMNFTKNAKAAKKAIDNTSVNKEIKRGVAEILSDTSPAALQKSIEIDNLMLKYPGMDRALAEQIATEINPRKKADIIAMVEQTIEMGNKGMSGDDIIQTFKNTPRTKQASGGIIGLTSNPRSASNKAGVETLFKRR
jgi:hypothetical protein